MTAYVTQGPDAQSIGTGSRPVGQLIRMGTTVGTSAPAATSNPAATGAVASEWDYPDSIEWNQRYPVGAIIDQSEVDNIRRNVINDPWGNRDFTGLTDDVAESIFGIPDRSLLPDGTDRPNDAMFLSLKKLYSDVPGMVRGNAINNIGEGYEANPNEFMIDGTNFGRKINPETGAYEYSQRPQVIGDPQRGETSWGNTDDRTFTSAPTGKYEVTDATDRYQRNYLGDIAANKVGNTGLAGFAIPAMLNMVPGIGPLLSAAASAALSGGDLKKGALSMLGSYLAPALSEAIGGGMAGDIAGGAAKGLISSGGNPMAAATGAVSGGVGNVGAANDWNPLLTKGISALANTGINHAAGSGQQGGSQQGSVGPQPVGALTLVSGGAGGSGSGNGPVYLPPSRTSAA